MVQRALNWILRREVGGNETPMCPDHHVPMRLRGVQGRPARFTYQTEEVYTYLYFCPIEGCNMSVAIERPRSQAPIASEVPDRPSYARPDDL